MGQPDSATFSRFEYGSSEVSFGYVGYRLKVTGWDNAGGNLQLVPYTPDGSTFTLGSSRMQVLNAMGNPDEISYTNWYYGNSAVGFTSSSASGVVDAWDNAGGNLALMSMPEN